MKECANNKANILPQVAFCNMVFKGRKVMVLYLCVGTGLCGEEKFCVGLLRRPLCNFTTDGNGSHPTSRYFRNTWPAEAL